MEAYSLGSVYYNIGNFLFEKWEYNFEFTAKQIPIIDANLNYNSATFVEGQTSRFELEVTRVSMKLNFFMVSQISFYKIP